MCKMVESEATSTTREFNNYSVYDWTTWLAYGSSPFSQHRSLQSDQMKDETDPIDSREDAGGATSATATSAVTLPSSAAGTSAGEVPVPKKKKKYDLRAPIQAAESSPEEKQFFDSLGVILSNGGVGFFMGSSLAYIAESRKSAPASSPSLNKEMVSEESLRTPAHIKSSSSHTIDPYQRAMASNMVKPGSVKSEWSIAKLLFTPPLLLQIIRASRCRGPRPPCRHERSADGRFGLCIFGGVGDQ